MVQRADSSLGFAAAHASIKDFPQLFALGTLLGFSYVRSRNLLTPMLIHGAWNGTVLLVLFAIVNSGLDIQEALNGKVQTAGLLQSLLLH